MQKKILIIAGAFILAIVLGAGAWYFLIREDAPTQVVPSEQITTSSTDPAFQLPVSLPELPEIVARVNNVDIIKKDLESTEARILAGQGIDTSTLTLENLQQLRAQSLDTLVSNQLLRQVSASSGITVEQAEIDAQVEVIKGQFEQPEQFELALVQQGISQEEFLANVKSDLAIQKYLDNKLGLAAIDVTEEELTALYEKQAPLTAEPMPPLAEIHDEFKAFAVQQQQQTLIVDHLKELSTQAEIEILIQ
jgi:SurA-like N-terminal domain